MPVKLSRQQFLNYVLEEFCGGYLHGVRRRKAPAINNSESDDSRWICSTFVMRKSLYLSFR
jgi:hypothetical protein